MIIQITVLSDNRASQIKRASKLRVITKLTAHPKGEWPLTRAGRSPFRISMNATEVTDPATSATPKAFPISGPANFRCTCCHP